MSAIMIIDCHTHIWGNTAQLGRGGAAHIARLSGRDGVLAGGREVTAGAGDHAASAFCVTASLVLGTASRHLGACVPNEMIGEYVAAGAGARIGIASVDPTEPGCVRQAEQWLDRAEFRGLVCSPAAQDFHPADTRAMALYEMAQARRAPVFFHQGTHFPAEGRMEYARPFLLDEIAREFPELTIVVSAMGHPWVDECIALIGKNARVFADVAALVRRPWAAHNALVLAHQFNVMDKLLFGSDFPYGTAADAIEGLYRLHEITQGTLLPSAPRKALREIVERDALEALGIRRQGELPPAANDVGDDDVNETV